MNWIAQTGANAHGQGEIFATTIANAFGDDFRNSNTVLVTVEDVKVAIRPQSVNLAPAGSQQFTATLTHATDTTVTWTATGGAIDPQGFYIAGNTPGTFSVTATSVEQPTKSASATVTINAPPITVTVSPATVTITPGQAQQFTAAVTGAANTAVTWSATGGTISGSGLYTAGNTPGTFTATSVEEPTESATAAVTIAAPSGVAGKADVRSRYGYASAANTLPSGEVVIQRRDASSGAKTFAAEVSVRDPDASAQAAYTETHIGGKLAAVTFSGSASTSGISGAAGTSSGAEVSYRVLFFLPESASFSLGGSIAAGSGFVDGAEANLYNLDEPLGPVAELSVGAGPRTVSGTLPAGRYGLTIYAGDSTFPDGSGGSASANVTFELR